MAWTEWIWSNYSDRKHEFSPQMVAKSKGNPLISGKPRLVKYYNLARMDLTNFSTQGVQMFFFWQKWIYTPKAGAETHKWSPQVVSKYHFFGWVRFFLLRTSFLLPNSNQKTSHNFYFFVRFFVSLFQWDIYVVCWNFHGNCWRLFWNGDAEVGIVYLRAWSIQRAKVLLISYIPRGGFWVTWMSRDGS